MGMPGVGGVSIVEGCIGGGGVDGGDGVGGDGGGNNNPAEGISDRQLISLESREILSIQHYLSAQLIN